MHRRARSCVLYLWIHVLTFVKGQATACQKPQVENGFVVISSNGMVYYTCNEGYKLSTKGWWGKAKCEDHSWSGLGECIEESKCGEIPEIPNGAMTPQHKVYEQDQYIEVVCKKGYLARLHWLICRDGNWDFNEFSPENICTPLPNNCNPPPKVENAFVVTPYQEEYSSNSEVTYQCHHNYIIKGGNTLRCFNGEWEEKNITCTDSVGCGAPPLLADGDVKHTMTGQYNHSESVEYMCQLYYTMEGGPNKTCVNGEWTGYMRCLKPCIANEDDFIQHNITLKSPDKKFFAHDDMMEFMCARGTPVGAMAMRQRCNSGEIRLPTCQ